MIPDEAVEAATKAFRETHFMDDALMNALEAAAPFIAAQAIRDAVEAFPLETITEPDNAVAWLLRRVRQLEAGS